MRINGKLIFAFSVDGDTYHVFYDEDLAQGPGYNRVVGAIYKLMKENPDLIEDFLQAAVQASEELSLPFENILHERPSENQT